MRDKIIWLIFCVTSLQLAFLQPYLVLVPGERANLFSGALCALSLAAVCLWGPKGTLKKSAPEVLISLALALLVFLSGLFSSTPGSSSARGFVILASGLGGFWCARILLATESRQRSFLRLGIIMLSGILLVSLISFSFWGKIEQFLDSNPHTLASRILILWFAPLALLMGRSGPAKVLGAILLVVSYLVFYLSNLRSPMLIPIFVGLLAVFFGTLRFKYLLILCIPLLGIITYFFSHLPAYRTGMESEPAYYRVENYPFSCHIALKHPWLGIGLRAPRVDFLKDYQIKYPYVTRDKLFNSVTERICSENIFLTFMVELGFPFLILFLFSLAILLRRLLRRVSGPAPPESLPPLTLLLTLAGALLYFQGLDGLLHPQLNWFFSILLGMIPPEDLNTPS